LPHSFYELVDSKGKLKGEFNKRQLKPYRRDGDSKGCGKQRNKSGLKPFKDEEQTGLFKGPVRTAL
jgi:hypothetical protein